MHSTAMKNLHSYLLPLLALAGLVIKIRGSASLHPVLTGPELAYLGSKVTFRCLASDSPPPVTYELMRDGDVLISSGTDDQGGIPAFFSLRITAASEGSYHCKAAAYGRTGVSQSIQLSVVTPASNTRVISEPFPPVAYEGSHVVLSCNVTKGSHLQYSWFFNRKELPHSASPFTHITGNKLVLENVTPEHAGNYYCMAWSQAHDITRFSSSSEVLLTVKVYVSKPRISFSIFKDGDSYRGNVTCWSTRGSPPVNFSLVLDDREENSSVTATESLIAWFPVAMVPGTNMGVARCLVKTDVQELMSEPVTLEVVPVGGEVRVEVEYLYRFDSQLAAAAALNCVISRGTSPHISWLFNDTALLSHEGTQTQPILSNNVLASKSQTLVLAKLGPEESGYYRCRVSNSYDESGPWVESAAVLVRVSEVFMTTLEVITIAFCCFLLLMLIMAAAFTYNIFDNEQAQGHSSTSHAGPDVSTISAPTSQSGYRQDDRHDVQNQVMEVTV